MSQMRVQFTVGGSSTASEIVLTSVGGQAAMEIHRLDYTSGKRTSQELVDLSGCDILEVAAALRKAEAR